MTNFYVGYSDGQPRIHRSGGLNKILSSSVGTTPTPTPTSAPTSIAVLLTTGSSYTVPTGATTMKAWAVGPGGMSGSALGHAGAVCYKTWSVSGGSSLSYSIGNRPAYDGNCYRSGSTTITYNGTTITAQGGSGTNTGDSGAATYSDGDGGANGGLAGYPPEGGASGGAVGGNGAVVTPCNRYSATDVSGLFDAVTMAGESVIESCSETAAFGSGGASNSNKRPGYGGGGAWSGTSGSDYGGPGVVVLLFTGSFPTPTPTPTPTPSSTSGGGGAFSITSQPLNDYVPNSSTNVTYSVTVTGGGTPTYQWQYYGMDEANSLYDDEWRNMSGATSSSLTLNGNNAYSYAGYPYYYNGQLKIRCIVTPSDGGSALTSHIVRMIQLDMLHQPYPTWYNGSNGNYSNYGSPQTISVASGESVKLDVSDYAMAGADTSWFSGNDTTFKIQVATTGHTDSADWTDLYSSDFRGYFSYMSGYEIFPSTGTKYYRVIMIAKWPYTATNGTGSATHATQPLYPHSPYDALQVTWP